LNSLTRLSSASALRVSSSKNPAETTMWRR
jgi:hypothetical protein